MNRIGISLIVLLLSLPVGAAFAQESAKENSALKAAKAWLTLIDAGKYGESWQEAASIFRGAVTRDQWEQSLRGVRKPLGRVLSRKVTEKTYTTSLPGAPDAEYVVIRFGSSFANKKAAVETVTPMLDEDGNWRVSGYYIK